MQPTSRIRLLGSLVAASLLSLCVWSFSAYDLRQFGDATVKEAANAVSTTSHVSDPSSKDQLPDIGDRIVVIGHRDTEDMSWVAENLPDWQRALYNVDNSSAPLHVELNKGREANVYLQYIISHYDHLPAIMAFIHAHHKGERPGWHVDAPNFDQTYTLKRLQIDYLRRHGYVNLRCQWSPGCPDEVQPFRQHTEEELLIPDSNFVVERQLREVWFEIFGNDDVPEVIATPCCAQFAVSREQVHKRPVEDYQRFQWWIRDTEIPEGDIGRIFEYLWHIIFGQEPIFCPDVDLCYNDVFGGGY